MTALTGWRANTEPRSCTPLRRREDSRGTAHPPRGSSNPKRHALQSDIDVPTNGFFCCIIGAYERKCNIADKMTRSLQLTAAGWILLSLGHTVCNPMSLAAITRGS